MRIDLVLFTDEDVVNINWQLGKVLKVAFSINEISTINKQIDEASDFLIFWDSNLGNPDTNLIQKLAESKVDVWHAGLKLGLAGYPKTIDYIHPAWVYNKDVGNKIISSSFRLSLRGFLIRTKTFFHVGLLPTGYQSIEMTGLALGYSIIKHGGIIRYHPEFVKQEILTSSIPDIDEWVFLRQFFPKKWQYWVLLNKKGLLRNYNLWHKTKHTNYSPVIPSLHSSNIHKDVNANYNSISVLAPTLDRYSYLINELRQLSVQTINPIEVLITDQTDKIRRQDIDITKYPNLVIKYFIQDDKGQCVAWNKLLEEATGDFVLFLGDDADNITPDFIEKLLYSLLFFDADIVASNVVEIGQPQKKINHHYYMSDTFPITLAKKSVVIDAGGMDMFFNKNIRADYDLALRCHENGALMIFDSSALIGHHRAKVGGLRAHKARVITNLISKNSIVKFTEPTTSEIFLVKRHFNKLQYKNYIRIKYFDQLIINGGVFRKTLRILLFVIKLPAIISRYYKNVRIVNDEFKNRSLSDN